MWTCQAIQRFFISFGGDTWRRKLVCRKLQSHWWGRETRFPAWSLFKQIFPQTNPLTSGSRASALLQDGTPEVTSRTSGCSMPPPSAGCTSVWMSVLRHVTRRQVAGHIGHGSTGAALQVADGKFMQNTTRMGCLTFNPLADRHEKNMKKPDSTKELHGFGSGPWYCELSTPRTVANNVIPF